MEAFAKVESDNHAQQPSWLVESKRGIAWRIIEAPTVTRATRVSPG